jgi:hypothetical protein
VKATVTATPSSSPDKLRLNENRASFIPNFARLVNQAAPYKLKDAAPQNVATRSPAADVARRAALAVSADAINHYPVREVPRSRSPDFLIGPNDVFAQNANHGGPADSLGPFLSGRGPPALRVRFPRHSKRIANGVAGGFGKTRNNRQKTNRNAVACCGIGIFADEKVKNISWKPMAHSIGARGGT